ncbi:hypothetical protein GCM10023089_39190 [Quisquiliibacterium transsilvanicum]
MAAAPAIATATAASAVRRSLRTRLLPGAPAAFFCMRRWYRRPGPDGDRMVTAPAYARQGARRAIAKRVG